jgi:methylenetetrahydrofolate dehydrogenase (NADP+)/methenyltetrahydrofolate cyclohydrolase
MDILFEARKDVQLSFKNTVAVVGATGMVGAPLVKELKKEGYRVLEANSKTINLEKLTLKADVVISATGIPNLIKPGMIKDGVIAIDVGSPHGDFDAEVSKKAVFFTPVPGGVGPVTISCLLENLIETC